MAQICDVIFPKIFVENTRHTTRIGLESLRSLLYGSAFRLDFGQYPYRRFAPRLNQRFLRK